MASPTFLSKSKFNYQVSSSPHRKAFDWDQIAAPRWRDFTISTPVGDGANADCWFDRDGSYLDGVLDDSFHADPNASVDFFHDDPASEPLSEQGRRKAKSQYTAPPAKKCTIPMEFNFATDARSTIRLQREKTPKKDDGSSSDQRRPSEPKRRITSKLIERPQLTVPNSPQFATTARSQIRQTSKFHLSVLPSETSTSSSSTSSSSSSASSASRKSSLHPSRLPSLASQQKRDRAPAQPPKTPSRMSLTAPSTPVFATAQRAQLWQVQRSTQKISKASEGSSGAAQSSSSAKRMKALSKSAVKPHASQSRIKMMTLTQPATPQFHTTERALIRERFQQEHKEEISYPTQIASSKQQRPVVARKMTMKLAPRVLQLTQPASPCFMTTQRAAMRQQMGESQRRMKEEEGARRAQQRAKKQQAPVQRSQLTLPQSPNFRTTERANIARTRQQQQQQQQRRSVFEEAENAQPAKPKTVLKVVQKRELTCPQSPQFMTTQRAVLRRAVFQEIAAEPSTANMAAMRGDFVNPVKSSRPLKRMVPTAPASPNFETTHRAMIKRQRGAMY